MKGSGRVRRLLRRRHAAALASALRALVRPVQALPTGASAAGRAQFLAALDGLALPAATQLGLLRVAHPRLLVARRLRGVRRRPRAAPRRNCASGPRLAAAFLADLGLDD